MRSHNAVAHGNHEFVDNRAERVSLPLVYQPSANPEFVESQTLEAIIPLAEQARFKKSVAGDGLLAASA